VSEHRSYGILEGIFRELLARHIRLGVRDYLDAVRALRMGFGGHTRDELRLFCHRLWGRNEREFRTIDAIFALTPAGDQGEIAELDRLLHSDVDLPRQVDQGHLELAETDDRRSIESRSGPHSPVFFAGADGQDGLALPPLKVSSRARESFTYNPQTVISQRELAVVWRRLRKLTRTGPRLELDVQSTIRERCHSGVLARPVLRPYRRNTASLLVLADVSPSMAPWRPFLQTLVDSLALGQLRAAEMCYFSNFPRKWIFRSSVLQERISLEEISRRNSGAALLIVSDGGAARGHFSPERMRRTVDFLNQAAEHFRPIVWINPMPRQRWTGTSAAALARQSRAVILPLDKESLIRAVDLLRGARAS
jgi:uncharacterized protein with von Willebrand factor type A (vWA) domain